MDGSLNGSGSLLPVAISITVIVLIILVAFFIQRSRRKRSLQQKTDISTPGHRFDYQPVTKPRPAIPSTLRLSPLARGAEMSRPKDFDLTTTRHDLTESLVALTVKYSLERFTIATADGLLFGSSAGDVARNDAATCSEIFKKDPLAERPGIVLLGIVHKGSELICIIRTKTPLPETIKPRIFADTKIILDWWI